MNDLDGGVYGMRNKRFFSIRSKVMLLSVVLAVCPLLIVSGFSYFESNKVVRNQVIDLNLANAQQISNNLDMIVNDVNTISLNLIQNNEIAAYLASPSTAVKQQNYPRILSILNDQTFNKKHIYSIYMQDLGEVGFDNRGAVNLVPNDMLLQAKALKGKDSWYLDTVWVQNKEVKVVSMIRDIRDINHISRSLGILKINILESSFGDLYRTKMKDKSLFYLIDERKDILSTISADQLGSPIATSLTSPDMARRTEGFFNTVYKEKEYLAVYYRMETKNWNILELTPYELIMKPGNVIKSVTIYSIVVSLVICLTVIFLFASRVLTPLKQIRLLMKRVERENFNLEMKVTGNDEITLLALGFNQMSQKLDELINEVHVSKIKQKEAELKALQEQINPHFLYNTLDLIYWMSRMEKAFDTSVMINSLSQLFRIGLNSGSRFTTVRKEAEHIQHYMLIQQKRYEETITFSLQIDDEDILDCTVTKMVLQPIVENAIRHGIEEREGSGRVDIHIFRDGVDLVYSVHDDGIGADETSIREKLNSSSDEPQGLGLKNIHDRIKLNYGSLYGIEFHSTPLKGTTVIVRQPYSKGHVTNV